MRFSIRRFRDSEAATSAIEFALIAPVLLLMMFGIIAYGYIFGVYHNLQQMASEAARASVAGLNDVERDMLARAFIGANARSYPLLDPAKLRVATVPGGLSNQSFEVAVAYDMSQTVFQRLAELVALPPLQVERRAVVQRGGY